MTGIFSSTLEDTEIQDFGGDIDYKVHRFQEPYLETQFALTENYYLQVL
jgi:hypothetical protein